MMGIDTGLTLWKKSVNLLMICVSYRSNLGKSR